MVKFSCYTEEDYESLVILLKSAGMFDENWESKEHLQHKIRNDAESIILAKDDDKIIGCLFFISDMWMNSIWRLSVLPEYRGQGIGMQLMEKAESILSSRGIKEVVFFVDPKKDRLKNWYKSQGYKQANDWTFMYKELK